MDVSGPRDLGNRSQGAGTPGDVPEVPGVPDDHTRGRDRAALTGTIFAMSVLAYLGDHETALLKAVVTVVGTGLVIFFAEAYAGLLSSSLASPHRLTWDLIGIELRTSSTAAAPGVVAGVLLLLADLVGFSAQLGIDIAMWVGVAGLTVCSVVASRAGRRSLAVRVGLVVASVVVGVVIIVLKAELH